ncbi:DMT family transporter [Actibacterium sp. 188UL27-1]|uniref:DMT family transporter n=1 Tax=Actibacterium sp. 188UL27-1 TaxID=2786961 RepID=UPI001959FE81|nr:DMT family transporter [Actibacterium sp. 188UL27-1]MBM7066726.1 DMT family transporter [Actibacterium sp. 188UL27-1]
MDRKHRIDAFGALSLILFSALLGFNQVAIKIVNDGLQPIFSAGLRSLGAVGCIWLFMVLCGKRVVFARNMLGPGVLIGLFFTFEFVCLFLALDLTTVTRTSVIFYSMPLWLALAGHFLLEAERLTKPKLAGLALAFLGVVWAIVTRDGGGEASLLGDLLALGAALGWTGIALCVRATRIREIAAEMQLMWQVSVSAVLLLALSPLFGPLLREPEAIHWIGLAFQTVVVATLGFMFWFWLLKIYPAASVAAFGFLSPIFGVAFGWVILNEDVGSEILVALVLVSAGLWLINRPIRG